MTDRIITSHNFPPIPVRMFDWSAHRDGYEPGDPVGTGATELICLMQRLSWKRTSHADAPPPRSRPGSGPGFMPALCCHDQPADHHCLMDEGIHLLPQPGRDANTTSGLAVGPGAFPPYNYTFVYCCSWVCPGDCRQSRATPG